MTTMTKRRRVESDDGPVLDALELVEQRRLTQRISQRRAAEWAGMSEATWRQLVARGVMQRGEWVPRHPRRDQVLDMAHAVGCLQDVADALAATEEELAGTRERVQVPSPAAQEILENRHLNLEEKAALLRFLTHLRSGNAGSGPFMVDGGMGGSD